jgi:hypothetical protein
MSDDDGSSGSEDTNAESEPLLDGQMITNSKDPDSESTNDDR